MSLAVAPIGTECTLLVRQPRTPLCELLVLGLRDTSSDTKPSLALPVVTDASVKQIDPITAAYRFGLPQRSDTRNRALRDRSRSRTRFVMTAECAEHYATNPQN